MIELYGVLFTLIIGTLLHYTYEWSGQSLLISLVAPTNESVFEHLKLLLTPFLIWSLNEYVHYGQFMKTFIPAKTIGVLVGMVFIVVAFYSYTGIFGKNYLAVDIGLFMVSVLISFGLAHWLMTIPSLGAFPVRIAADAVLLITVLSFMAFSIYPPERTLFQSPPAGRR